MANTKLLHLDSCNTNNKKKNARRANLDQFGSRLMEGHGCGFLLLFISHALLIYSKNLLMLPMSRCCGFVLAMPF